MARSASKDCNEHADRDWMFSHEEIREMIRIHREWPLYMHHGNTKQVYIPHLGDKREFSVLITLGSPYQRMLIINYDGESSLNAHPASSFL